MIEVKKFLAAFVITICVTCVFNIEIRCEYYMSKFYTTTTTEVEKYDCTIFRINLSKVKDKDVKTITGFHQNDKNNSDVEVLNFFKVVDTSYFATFSKLQEFLPNFNYLYIYHSNLTGISNQDLKHFSNLQYIEIDNCSTLITLPSSIFQFNQQLKFIKLTKNNQLKFVGKDIFKNLPNLQSIIWKENGCLSEDISCEGREQIDELSARLPTSCFLDESDDQLEMSTEEVTTSEIIYIDNDLRKNSG